MIQQRVLEAIAKIKDIDPEQIDPNDSFEELGVDSVDAMELLFEVEEQFDVVIPDEEAAEITHVRDVIVRLEEALGDAGTRPVEPSRSDG